MKNQLKRLLGITARQERKAQEEVDRKQRKADAMATARTKGLISFYDADGKHLASKLVDGYYFEYSLMPGYYQSASGIDEAEGLMAKEPLSVRTDQGFNFVVSNAHYFTITKWER